MVRQLEKVVGVLVVSLILAGFYHGQTWNQIQQITSGGVGQSYDDYYGTAMSSSQSFLIVGAPKCCFPCSCTNYGTSYIMRYDGAGFVEQALLTASNHVTGNAFGFSVAITETHALVGAPYANIGSLEGAGAAYVFVRSGDTWTEEAILTASNKDSDDIFGFSVGMNGEIALVGSPYSDPDSVYNCGAAYLYSRSGSSWAQTQVLMASNKSPNSYFAWSVSIVSSYALVGAPNADPDSVSNAGAAYVFAISGSTWSQQAILKASNKSVSSNFGWSVSIIDDAALVGAPFADQSQAIDSGIAYIFTRSPSTWTESARLIASNKSQNDNFGRSVSLQSNYASIGTAACADGQNSCGPGISYIFSRSGSSWSESQKLSTRNSDESKQPSTIVTMQSDYLAVGCYEFDTALYKIYGTAVVYQQENGSWNEIQTLKRILPPTSHQYFAQSMASTESYVIVGTPSMAVGTMINAGAAMIFVRSGSLWTQEVSLTASDKSEYAQFGYPVAITNTHALIGAQGARKAYIFSRSGEIWTEEIIFPRSGDYYLASVSLTDSYALIIYYNGNNGYNGYATIYSRSGGTWNHLTDFYKEGDSSSYFWASSLTNNYALIGAHNENSVGFYNSGAAYMFSRSGSTWLRQASLTASNKRSSNYFGMSVSHTDDLAIIGAIGANSGGISYSGAAYIFSRSGTVWEERALLTASNKQYYASFGRAVYLKNNYALIGAPNAGGGSAYVFSQSGELWTEIATLSASNGRSSDGFGSSLTMTNEYLFVGAPYFDASGINDVGAAFIFDYPNYSETPNEQSNSGTNSFSSSNSPTITNSPSGSSGLTSSPSDSLSHSQSLRPNRTRSRSRRSTRSRSHRRSHLRSRSRTMRKSRTRTFRRSFTRQVTQQRTESASLVESPSDVPNTGLQQHSTIFLHGTHGKRFGAEVAVWEDYLLISKHQCRVGDSSKKCGRVYILKKNEGNFALISSIRHPGSVSNMDFGETVAARNSWILVRADSITDKNKSSVFVFSIDSHNQLVQPKMRLNLPTEIGRYFGRSLTMGGSFVVVGVPEAPSLSQVGMVGACVIYFISNQKWGKQPFVIQPGWLKEKEHFGYRVAAHNAGYLAISNQPQQASLEAVFIYRIQNKQTSFVQKIQLSDRAGFGKTILLWQNTLYVAAPDDSTHNSNAGSVHIYHLTENRRFEYLTRIATGDVQDSHAGTAMCATARFLLVSHSVCPKDATCDTSGKVDVFFKKQNTWEKVDTLDDGFQDGSDQYGYSVACSDDVFVVGAPESQDVVVGGGLVHTYMA